MTDLSNARRMMVDGQVRTSDVTDRRIIDAMLAVPREDFLPAGKRELAYLDMDLPLGKSAGGEPQRALLKPMTIAKLLQAAAIGEGDRVLDVGASGGYVAAVVSHFAHAVVALDDSALAASAKSALKRAGCANVQVVSGDLPSGWPDNAPYDVILLEGAVEFVPAELQSQLAENGRLLCIEGTGPASKAMLYRAAAGTISGRPIFDATAPALPGFTRARSFVF